MSGLGRIFLDHWKGPNAAGDVLDAPLTDLHGRGQRRWPEVELAPEAFVRHLAERAPADAPPAEALGRLRAEDLYLACACLQGAPAGLRAFESAILVPLRRRFPRHLAQPPMIDEALQTLRTALFVGTAERPPKIVQYGGLGALESWVRVAAVRTALNLAAAERRRGVSDDGALELVLAPGADPELDYLRARYERPFLAALRTALLALDERARNLLRFRFADDLAPERIGRIYGVHRTTAMRWLAEAQDQVLQRTRAILMEQLRVSPAECDSLLNLVRSRLAITLRSLLESADV